MAPETLSPKEREVLRRLAHRKAEIAHSAANAQRRDAWYRLDSGEGSRPMILAEPFGVRDAVQWMAPDALECQSDWARGIERWFHCELYLVETLKDDHVLEPVYNVPWAIKQSDYGVQVVNHHGQGEGVTLGAKRWDAPIQDLEKDFEKLKPRTFSVDREATRERCAQFEDLFGDILNVRIRCNPWWTLGMTNPAIQLIGLENLMMAMYDQPEALHRFMAFMRDDHLRFVRWMEAEGLLTLNNENDYIGSGSTGYTRDLPQPDYDPDGPVRTKDLWVLTESQETVGVGPDQFAEFIYPYQKEISETFGKTYYGCCEPVDNRWHVLKGIGNLARVSVSPWCDEEAMAANCGTEIVYSRKPNPTQVSTETFDEDAIRADLRKTLEVARGCRLEIVMKDVHTLKDDPTRLVRWVRLAREMVEEVHGVAAV
jgi:hypothetical protein